MKKIWISLVCFVSLAGICLLMLNIGARIGEASGRSGYHNFYTRSLAYMISELDEHRKKEEIGLLMSKVKLLNEKWDTVGKPDEFRIFRGEFDAIPDSETEIDPVGGGQ